MCVCMYIHVCVCVYRYIFFFRFFCIIGCYKMLPIVPCAIPSVLVGYPFYI